LSIVWVQAKVIADLVDRIQVKYRTVSRGVLPMHFRSIWSDRNGVHRRPMAREEVDVLAVYSPDTRECDYIDPDDFGESVSLRVEPPRNGQTSGVTMASDFRAMPPSPRPGGD
jgi:hypothetical protein